MKKLFELPKIQNRKQYDCVVCGLDRNTKTSYKGKGKKKILIIDQYKQDQYIQSILYKNNINLFNDCWIVKPLLCDSYGTKLTLNHFNSCQKELDKIIKELQPKKIITFGVNALKTIIGPRLLGRLTFGGADKDKKKSAFQKVPEKWLGQQIPDQYYNSWIFPLEHYHNLDKERFKKDNSENIFKRQLKEAIEHNSNFYTSNYTSECIIVKELEKAIAVLNEMQKKPNIAFDYETTGLKPHAKGHKIHCIGISDGILSYGMPIFDDPVFLSELKKLLQSRNVKKFGWNMKFEQNWTQEILGYPVKSWLFDGMLGSHTLSNVGGITGLKFQTYVQLGIVGYDTDLDSYLKAKTANELNTIHKAPIDKTLLYVAHDAHFTYLTANVLRTKMYYDDSLYKGYMLLHNGVLGLADAEQNGIAVDEERLLENDLKLEKKLFAMEKRINEFRVVKKWDGLTKFNFSSNKQLGHLLYNILGKECHKTTKGLASSVDVEALSYYESMPFISNILDYKKIYKLKNTYLKNFKEEVVNGLMHPFFNLHIPVSYRSSSSKFNFQNCPKRDETAKKFIRSIIKPRQGNMLVEIDYSSVEVTVGALYHKDKNMIKYLNDPSTDMHRDAAMDVFLKDISEVTKEERQIAKQFVFAQFYGDWWKPCAENIWKQIQDSTKEHLKKKGINSFDSFSKIVEEAEHVLWEDRFFGYAKWRKDTWKKYLETGYIEYLTGFRIYSNMDRKQACNYQIQGTAFHCLLRGLIEVNKYLKKNKFNTQIIGQIHDSLVLDADKAEWELLKPNIKKIMLHDIRDEWKWIFLPLKAEIDYYYDNWYQVDKSEKFC